MSFSHSRHAGCLCGLSGCSTEFWGFFCVIVHNKGLEGRFVLLLGLFSANDQYLGECCPECWYQGGFAECDSSKQPSRDAKIHVGISACVGVNKDPTFSWSFLVLNLYPRAVLFLFHPPVEAGVRNQKLLLCPAFLHAKNEGALAPLLWGLTTSHSIAGTSEEERNQRGKQINKGEE